MTSIELRTFLIAWIRQILVTEGGEADLKIIASNPNAPIPLEPHITISYGSNRDRFGRASKGDVYFNEEDPEDPKNGTRKLVADYTATVEIRETGGDGDRLQALLDSLDREDIYRDYFQANHISHLGNGELVELPRLKDDSWIKEALVELQLGIATGVEETTSYIETVAYEGDIGGLQE